MSSTTIRKYIQILEAIYIIFIITPYTTNIARSLLKVPKIYFCDTALVDGSEGSRLENLVAVSLLKDVYARVDNAREDYALSYLRTKDGKEVDFVITHSGKAVQAFEVKISDHNLSKSLLMLKEQYRIPSIQLVKSLRREYKLRDMHILKTENYLKNCYL